MYILSEATDSSIKIGDVILAGKFKNKRCTIKGFSFDDNGQPRVKTDRGEFNVYSFRLEKLMPKGTAEK